jgi:general secretion pathway protein A
MYETFYGLRENPFNVTPDPQFIYLGKSHREALAQLLYGVKAKKGFIVMTGEVGTGKTTLIHYLLEKLNGNDDTKTAFLFNPKLTVYDFIEYILKDLGVVVQKGTKGDYLHILHQNLLKAYQNDEKVVLIVDEAQGLNPALLEEIRLLSNLETSKSKLLQIVLVGQPELNKTLEQPGFRQLRQRINMRYHLPAFNGNETKEYIANRLRIAGAKRSIFTIGAIEEIHERTGGIPRLINILCDNSLLIGYASDKIIIDEKVVNEAANDLKLKRGIFGTWSWILLSMGRGLFGIWSWIFIGISIAGVILLILQFGETGYRSYNFTGWFGGLQRLVITPLERFLQFFR